MQWIVAVFNWFNVWARLRECEADRALKGTQIRDVQDELVEVKQDLTAMRRLHYIGTFSVNSDGIIVQASERMADISGYTVSELIGLDLGELLPFRDRGRHTEHFRALVCKQIRLRTTPLEVELRRKSGTEVQVLVSLSESTTTLGRIFRADVRRR